MLTDINAGEFKTTMHISVLSLALDANNACALVHLFGPDDQYMHIEKLFLYWHWQDHLHIYSKLALAMHQSSLTSLSVLTLTVQAVPHYEDVTIETQYLEDIVREYLRVDASWSVVMNPTNQTITAP